MKKRTIVLLALAHAAFWCAVPPIATWSSLQPDGDGGGDILSMIAWIFCVYIFIFCAFVFVFAFPFSFKSIAAQKICILMLLTICLLPVSFWISGSISWSVQLAEFEKFVVRSQPLITAIKSFSRDEKQPPISLEQLVPKYIDRIPKVGLSKRTKFDFWRSKDGKNIRSGGNSWTLCVDLPTGFLDLHYLCYYPNGKYQKPPSGFFERVKGWAFIVHF